jgi:hypothetical protein
MLVLISAVLLLQDMPGYQKTIVYFFGLIAMVVDILRSAINSPVFLTMMQPLSSHERLRAHTIVKGIMDPFASLLTGVILLVLIRFQHTVHLLTLSYVLLAISVCWIIGVFRVNTQYLKMIVRTISSRYFNREDFAINDSGTLEWLKEKIRTGSDTEISNILNLIYNSSNERAHELVILALQHPSEKVKLIAARMIHQKNIPVAPGILVPLLNNAYHPEIIAEVIRILIKSAADNTTLLPFIESRHHEVQQAALAGLLNYGDPETNKKILDLLKQMMLSDQPGERKKVAEILGEQNNFGHMDMILQLMMDKSPEVRRAAFLAAGKSGNEMLLKELINKINTDEKEIIQPLFNAGESSLPVIASFIGSGKPNSLQKEKLILLCGRIGGSKAHQLLLVLLNTLPEQYMIIIKALYRCNYTPAKQQQEIFTSMAKKLLEHSAGIIYMQNSLLQHGEKYRLLINAFSLELISIRESLLHVFAIMYDRENINKVRTAYSTGKKESIINAMEILDISVRKDLSGNFNIIYEPGEISERMHGLRKVFPSGTFENAGQVLSCILEDKQMAYHYWTTACSLYTSREQRQHIDSGLIKKYTDADNVIVRETALYAL